MTDKQTVIVQVLGRALARVISGLIPALLLGDTWPHVVGLYFAIMILMPLPKLEARP